MRIVIDLQGAQSTGSRDRGIGRYTLSLVQAIVRNREGHDVLIALNGLFPETIAPIRAMFDGLLSQENIRVWRAPSPMSAHNAMNAWRRSTGELVREAFLASLNPDVVLISSQFEGLGDDAVISIGRLNNFAPTAVILYDLIPLIQRHRYLDNPVTALWYENKLDHLRRANLLLAISESSRQEGIRYLGFLDDACVNISAAVNPHFSPIKVDAINEQEIRNRYALSRKFVMYTGGIDYRKNIEGLIRAYAKLPAPLKENHQLAIICSINASARGRLTDLAAKEGLSAGDIVLTGFVPEDDLVALYNLCEVFVFPSEHEGFGLPVLEAMSCGKAVICSNASSLPEVIDYEEALFDPANDADIAEKLLHVLTDSDFREQLAQHGLEKAKQFSWEISARKAISALEELSSKKSHEVNVRLDRRPKLAYLSPLPPERSGISDYSAELLSELARYYDIDVILEQSNVSSPHINANYPVRTVTWFREHADRYERVLYHFGNSEFHQHMFGLLEEIPGIVVLHDFFLSAVIAHMEGTGYCPNGLTKALYQSHGYSAVDRRFHAKDPAEVIWHYPCNLDVIRNALSVIVHSENSRVLANKWYGDGAAAEWSVVPLLRVPGINVEKLEARRRLGLNTNDFIVCSFGMLGPIKLNHRLLDAWLASDLSKEENCVLIFVGENDQGEYGAGIVQTIHRNNLQRQVSITGWTDATNFRYYLAAADVGVQLRTMSRGETSAAVLDCMNYSLPTIVNAHGSMADWPEDVLLKLTDEFSDSELIDALNLLWKSSSRREQLGAKARELILTRHAPRLCADQYAEIIENTYQNAFRGTALMRTLAAIEPVPNDSQPWSALARDIAFSIESRPVPRQLMIDISGMEDHEDLRNILPDLLRDPPEGYRVEPVYYTSNEGYRYARRFTLQLIDCPESLLNDDVIEFGNGDRFLRLNSPISITLEQKDFYQHLQHVGVQVQFINSLRNFLD